MKTKFYSKMGFRGNSAEFTHGQSTLTVGIGKRRHGRVYLLRVTHPFIAEVFYYRNIPNTVFIADGRGVIPISRKEIPAVLKGLEFYQAIRAGKVSS